MIEQLAFTSDGRIRGKVDAAIQRLKCFEPDEGYYVAFSGGKDSQCVYHLCQMAGVKFDAHYAVTSVDPPELVQFIKEHYPDAWAGRHKSGETMWSLIPKRRMPPTRVARYCCTELKETGGEGRVTVTGVRWAESNSRRSNQGVITFPKIGKKGRKELAEYTPNFTRTMRGGVVLNDDNDANRRAVEHCYRTHKTLINPIVDWLDEDVWEFLNNVAKVPHCCLYDEGFQRIGCIGCPMSTHKRQELQRWPKYRAMYMRSFEKMIKERENNDLANSWQTAEEVMEWWLSK